MLRRMIVHTTVCLIIMCAVNNLVKLHAVEWCTLDQLIELVYMCTVMTMIEYTNLIR